MYDSAIHKDSMFALKFLPVSMFLVGYWAMGSSSVFANLNYEIEYIS